MAFSSVETSSLRTKQPWQERVTSAGKKHTRPACNAVRINSTLQASKPTTQLALSLTSFHHQSCSLELVVLVVKEKCLQSSLEMRAPMVKFLRRLRREILPPHYRRSLKKLPVTSVFLEPSLHSWLFMVSCSFTSSMVLDTEMSISLEEKMRAIDCSSKTLASGLITSLLESLSSW